VVDEYWRKLPAPRPRLYFFHSRRPDMAVDITQVQADKWRALQAHRSQGIGSRAAQFNARTSQGGNGTVIETLREAQP
jgi:LmbE family N-acetylglucosaminyl deacetylase